MILQFKIYSLEMLIFLLRMEKIKMELFERIRAKKISLTIPRFNFLF